MPAGRAGVDDGHADTRPYPVVRLRGARADGDRDTIHFAARRAVVVEALDGRMIRQLPDDSVRKLDHQSVDEPSRRPSLPPRRLTSVEASAPGFSVTMTVTIRSSRHGPSGACEFLGIAGLGECRPSEPDHEQRSTLVRLRCHRITIAVSFRCRYLPRLRRTPLGYLPGADRQW